MNKNEISQIRSFLIESGKKLEKDNDILQEFCDRVQNLPDEAILAETKEIFKLNSNEELWNFTRKFILKPKIIEGILYFYVGLEAKLPENKYCDLDEALWRASRAARKTGLPIRIFAMKSNNRSILYTVINPDMSTLDLQKVDRVYPM